MTHDQLCKIIENLSLGDECKLDTSTFIFGLTLTDVLDDEIVLFGGHGTHIGAWSTITYDADEIAQGIENHMHQYHSNVTEWITLDECKLVTE